MPDKSSTTKHFITKFSITVVVALHFNWHNCGHKEEISTGLGMS
ncbi:hypothetical protein T07_1169 [Trichinella nelsoni]|uniref:Uncharacterized protein n=1 Tax=Trichinella nelsoni TaxID=6336 RepID=A0A0V0RAT1_9BILA|nr:hypothetical protein T07_1169 [Trichinella nelsoni]